MPFVLARVAVALAIGLLDPSPRVPVRRPGPDSGTRSVPAVGRQVPSSPEADSAAAARRHYREGAAAYRKGDYTAARPLFRAAQAAWPGSEPYTFALAAVSARLSDTVETARWLEQLAAMGFGQPLDQADDFALIRTAPAVARAMENVRHNAEPAIRSRIWRTVEQADLFPEGIAFDPRTRRWLLASVRHGKVVAVDSVGKVSDFATPTPEGFALLGIRIDPTRRLLWATAVAAPQGARYQTADSGRSGVLGIDLDSGKLRYRLMVPDRTEPRWLGDLVLDRHGNVYLSDSQAPVLYRVRVDGKTPVLEEYLRHPLFRSLQGLALDSTERTLYLADYSHGILAVDLAEKKVTRLPAPEGTTVLGVDGLLRFGTALIGLQNGVTPPRIIRMDVDPTGRRITAVTQLDRHLPLADQPTLGTIWNGRLFYVANSPWERFTDAGQLKPGVTLPRPVILELPLETHR